MPPASDATPIAFGPITSRRFGRSLGVNHIPPKHCTYSCTYCQVGATPRTESERHAFYGAAAVIAAVRRKVEMCRAQGEPIDVISFVPDGEPTLDVDLGAEIAGVKKLGIPVVVITNGSLLTREDVRRDLAEANIVSVEVDTVDEEVWRRLDRPTRNVELGTILQGMRTFAAGFRGSLVTQTMLIAGVNDDPAGLERVAAFIATLSPSRACLSAPTRPPADSRVAAPGQEAMTRAYAIFAARLRRVDFLGHAEDEVFVRTGDPAEDLLATLAVHPMREETLLGGGVPPELLAELVAAGRISRVEHAGTVFLARR